MDKEFHGNIEAVRAVEDAIRASKKYTEGIKTIRHHHPIQGEDEPSRKFCKYYEVYPDVAVSWDMPAGRAIDLLWGDIRRIDVVLDYDYRVNKAKVIIKTGNGAVAELSQSIPGFGDAISRIDGPAS